MPLTARSAFNATTDYLIGRPVWVWKLTAVIVAVLIVLSLIRSHDDGLRESGREDIRDSVAEFTALRLHRQKDSIGKRIDTVSVAVTRTVHRLDTLWQNVPESLTTRADTIKAIEALPQLRLATDSAIRACSEYQNWFTRYRNVCDSLDHARTDEIDGLKRQLAKAKPSKYQTALKWGEIIGAAYIGFKVGRK